MHIKSADLVVTLLDVKDAGTDILNVNVKYARFLRRFDRDLQYTHISSVMFKSRVFCKPSIEKQYERTVIEQNITHQKHENLVTQLHLACPLFSS